MFLIHFSVFRHLVGFFLKRINGRKVFNRNDEVERKLNINNPYIIVNKIKGIKTPCNMYVV